MVWVRALAPVAVLVVAAAALARWPGWRGHIDNASSCAPHALDHLPLASISGQVIDFSTGLGAAGVTVSAAGELEWGTLASPRTPVTTVSGDGGAFTLRGLYPGTIRLTGRRRDLATRVATIVPLMAGDGLESVEVWVDAAYSIRGTVARRSGQGGSNGGVWVRARDSQTGESVVSTRASNDDGSFELAGLRPAGYELDVRGGAPNLEDSPFRPTGASVLVENGSIDGEHIELDDPPPVAAADSLRHRPPARDESCPGTVTGTVTGIGGRPAARVHIVATEESSPSAGTRAVLSDEGGRFAIRALCPGTYRLSAHALDNTGRATLDSVHVGDHVALKLGRPATLFGNVRDAGGAPVSRFVSILTGPMVRRERVEDGDGNFRLPWLDPGHYELIVQAGEAHATAKVDLLPDDVRSVQIVVPSGS